MAVPFFMFSLVSAWCADELRPAPPDAPKGAPAEFSRFELLELKHGFMQLAFGSDLRTMGESDDRIHKFDHRVRVRISNTGRTDRTALYRQVVENFVLKVPELNAVVVDESQAPDIIVRLLDTRDFAKTLTASLGSDIAREFISQTNPRCTTRLRASKEGAILRADVFIVVDQGIGTFLDCAYHETMHAFGLMNHANDVPWTTLNQGRKVGYFSIYDQAMLRILYNPLIRAGMGRTEVEEVLAKLLSKLD